MTDANGRYSANLPFHPGSHWKATFQGKRFHTLEELTNVAIPSAGDLEIRPVTLGPAGAANGRVVGLNGEPVAGALIEIAPGRNGSSYGLMVAPTTVASSSGHFELNHAPLGQLGVAVSADGMTTAFFPKVTFEREVVTALGEVTLEPSQAIAGTVVDEHGLPVAKQRVRARSIEEYSSSSQAITGADGSFHLELKSNLPHEIFLSRAGYKKVGAFAEDPMLVEAGTTDVRIQLSRLLQTSFQVVDYEGLPIEVFHLQVVRWGGSKSPKNVYSSAGGSDPLKTHRGGEQRLPARPGLDLVRARAAGYLPFEGDVTFDPDTQGRQTIRLRKGATVRGRVLRGEEALEGATVTVAERRSYGMFTKVSAKTDDEGQYEVHGFGAGEASILAVHRGQDLQGVQEIVVGEDLFLSESQAPVVFVEDLVMSGPGSIIGKVLLPAGVEPDGLMVYAGNWGDATTYPVLADRSFRIPEVKSGTQEISITGRPGVFGNVPPVASHSRRG